MGKRDRLTAFSLPMSVFLTLIGVARAHANAQHGAPVRDPQVSDLFVGFQGAGGAVVAPGEIDVSQRQSV